MYGLHGVKHLIIEYLQKEKVMTDRQTNGQTDRISSCRLDPFCRRGRVKIQISDNNIRKKTNDTNENQDAATTLQATGTST